MEENSKDQNLSLFLKDKNGRILTCNKNYYKNADHHNEKAILSKSDFDIPIWSDMAKSYDTGEQLTLKAGLTHIAVEKLPLVSGGHAEIITMKSPLIMNDFDAGLKGKYKIIDQSLPRILEKGKVEFTSYFHSIILNVDEIKILYYICDYHTSYNELTQLFFISLSAIKKRVSQIYDKYDLFFQHDRTLQNLRKITEVILNDQAKQYLKRENIL